MISRKKYTEAVLETYRMLFKEATPSVDYDELVENCCRYDDENHQIVTTDKPLTKEEMLSRGWRKAIDYMAYYLDQDRYKEIVEGQIAKYKMRGYEANGFRTEMYLGWGPTSCKPDEMQTTDGTGTEK